MEDDGTEVDDEEYFQCLESGTVFLLLRGDEKWKPQGSTSGYYSIFDITVSTQLDFISNPPAPRHPTTTISEINKLPHGTELRATIGIDWNPHWNGDSHDSQTWGDS